jgi:hypothetical protein
MALYQDFDPPANPTPENIYRKIADLMVGAASVEVIPKNNTVILRVWFAQPYRLEDHTKIT